MIDMIIGVVALVLLSGISGLGFATVIALWLKSKRGINNV